MTDKTKSSFSEVSLDDKYTKSSGLALMTGMQALVRLVLEQTDLDKAKGLTTRAYISGYRGSPVGGFDDALMRAHTHLETRGAVFKPGLNEDLAMTAMGGTQQIAHHDAPEIDGVTGFWYGKGPGVDRSIDAIKHVSIQGTAPKGGVLMIAGDDASGKSSSLAHQSEQSLVAGYVPILFPASIHEFIPLGLHGIALSRYAGCVAALKVVSDTAEGSAIIELDKLRPEFAEIPQQEHDLHVAPGFVPFLDIEQRLIEQRLPAAVEYARLNKLNVAHFAPNQKKLGIVAVGRTFVEALEALKQLGIKDPSAIGIGLFKVSFVWPMEPDSFLEFAEGYDELVILEDKREFFEPLARATSLKLADDKRPLILGKFDEGDNRLMPSFGELNTDHVKSCLISRLSVNGIAFTQPKAKQSVSFVANAPTQRIPWYCSGCPHNSSTKLPEGATAASGIGCHTISALIDAKNHTWCSQMGGEGGSWMGRAPFSSMPHMFQNLGDGTYDHSGSLAIRASIASGVNITYKILYNDAVALTGGQSLDSGAKPWDIARQVLAEGVKKVCLVSDLVHDLKDEPAFPSQVSFHPRSELIEVQNELKQTAGTTVLLYVQTCAAEKRRRRKKGTFPNPPKRVMIANRVCEGCGDCGLKSNCVSIKPLETTFGTKRAIDQTSCNKDYSCLQGFCPSFITVEHSQDPLKGPDAGRFQEPSEILPEPQVLKEARLLVTGIGGTGIVTVGAVLAMAARLEGKFSLGLDQTGLSQKNGAVTSHIQIGPNVQNYSPARLPAGSCDTLIACDLLTGAGNAALETLKYDALIIYNSQVEPLAAFAKDSSQRPKSEDLLDRINYSFPDAKLQGAEANALATVGIGDGMGTNFIMVGMACQNAGLPVSPQAIERAIELNGVSVAMNRLAFRLGRWIAFKPDLEESLLSNSYNEPKQTISEHIEHLSKELVAHQNRAYAERFKQAASDMQHLEMSVENQTDCVRTLYKIMAYKDEYEVARLLTSDQTRAELATQFKQGAKIFFNLAPPLLSKVDPISGEPRKIKFGPWIVPLLRLLAKGKTLRGGPFDLFGQTQERKIERALVAYAFALIAQAKAGEVSNTDLRFGFDVLAQIKGFGPVKLKAYAKAKLILEQKLKAQLP